jgi:hypothetical protein
MKQNKNLIEFRIFIMFKYFKNIGKVNKVWRLLNENYFKSLDGKTGSTVIKIEEDSMTGNHLVVQTDNENVKLVLLKNESQILNDIKNELGLFIAGITVI